jgi:predicted transcriptional regulator
MRGDGQRGHRVASSSWMRLRQRDCQFLVQVAVAVIEFSGSKRSCAATSLRCRRQRSIKDVARLLLERRISRLPVIDDEGRVLGVVSKGDIVSKERGIELDVGRAYR